MPAGRFRRVEVDGTWVGQFAYATSYLRRTEAVPLDPNALPLGPARYETGRREGLPGAIRDSMPDFWGRFVLARQQGVAAVDEMSLLLSEAADRIGALVFSESPESPEPIRATAVTLEALLEAADRLVADQDAVLTSGLTHEAAMQLALDAAGLLIGTSAIGGGRPKATVSIDGVPWIAKFPKRTDVWDNPLVEYAMLRLADEVGIDVPDVRLERIGGRSVLLVRRFDRTVDAATGAVARARFLSGLTLLDSDDTAGSASEWSYLRLADELKISAAPIPDRRALFARMVFNACISNEDDHPRNHAVIALGADFRLSPAYDLTPSPQHGAVRRLAMTTGIDDSGSLTRAANAAVMMRGRSRFGHLSEEDARARITQISQAVQARWERVVLDAGGTRRDCDLIRSAFMPEAFWYDWNA